MRVARQKPIRQTRLALHYRVRVIQHQHLPRSKRTHDNHAAANAAMEAAKLRGLLEEDDKEVAEELAHLKHSNAQARSVFTSAALFVTLGLLLGCV